jgi:hypothetical protein
MTNSRVFCGLLLSIALLAGAAQAGAAEPDGKAVKEAKERTARGLHLFENGDNAGALVEFERAQELVPNRLLLYRIALVYVAMDKPVDALESLDEVLSDPGALKPEYVARAKAAKEEQQHRVGELDVKANVPGTVEINIDGASAGEGPLTAPLRVAAGEHIVTVVAPGHIPLRQPVTVPAQGRAELAFELLPTEAKLAHVTVHSPLPGAEVRLDDELLGKTPLTEPVMVLPGKHVFEMQRPGYMTSRRVLNLGDGVYSAVVFDPDEDSSADDERGRLSVVVARRDDQAKDAQIADVQVTGVQVTIDSRERGTYRQPIALPVGLHVVKVERTGFEPLERLAEVTANKETEVKVSLRPTDEVRAARVAHANSYKTWAVAALVSGALIAGGSAGLALWSNSKLPTVENGLALAKQDTTGGGPCDPSNGLTDQTKTLCEQRMADAQGKVDQYRNLRLGGIIGGIAGAALVGVGVTLLLVAPGDRGHDDRDDTFAGSLVPVLSASPDGASLWLRGQF